MAGLVVITGAGSGIGSEIAKTLSASGSPLLLLGRNREPMEALSLPQTMVAEVDVTDGEAFVDAVSAAQDVYGPVDCLVNNAGLMLLGRIATQDPAEWQRMFDVNLMGVMNGIHAVLPGMVERESGTIINISSVAGRKTFPNHTAYVGTKFGIHAISENLREEVAPNGVRVTVIAPGAVETPLLSHTTSEDIKAGYEEWKKEIGGPLDPGDVARAVQFAYEQPAHVCIREIVLAATRQSA